MSEKRETVRILVHGLVGTNIGGIETFLLNMNDAMSKDVIFDYVIEEKSCIHAERISDRGGCVYKIRSRSKSPVGNTIDIIRLYKTCRRKYNVIYYNLSSLSWILPEIVARIMRYEIVVHSHNAMLIDVNSGKLHRIMNALNKNLLGHIHATRLACSKYAAKFMFGKSSYEIVYNGIDVTKYRFSRQTRKMQRKKYHIPSDAFVIGTVGRLAYQKNSLFIIEVFKEIAAKRNDAMLVMVGEGDLKEEIINKIGEYGLQDKILLTGLINDVYRILNAFDVFLLPSRHEGLGIALIEAQSNGLLSFTSEDVVPKEAKITDLLMYISLNKGAHAWAEIIQDVNKNANLHKRCKYNDLVCRTNYNIKEQAARLERILRQEK